MSSHWPQGCKWYRNHCHVWRSSTASTVKKGMSSCQERCPSGTHPRCSTHPTRAAVTKQGAALPAEGNLLEQLEYNEYKSGGRSVRVEAGAGEQRQAALSLTPV
eukprot:1157207-Pelagomonas_calceolata.AAC.4